MTLMSDAECNNSLARRYGANKGYNAPTQIDIELWAGDPRTDDGVEMDAAGGYAAAVVNNNGTTWPDAPSGRQVVTMPIGWTPTGEWTAGGDPADATHWLIRNHTTGDAMDAGPIGEPIIVTSADDAFSLQFAVNYVPIVAVA